MNDAEYLRELEGRYSDPTFMAAFGVPTGEGLPELYEHLLRMGADPDVLTRIRDSLASVPNDLKSKRRWTVENFLIPQILELLPEREAQRAAKIPIGCAYTRTVNAFTVSADSGNPVILTDQGATLWLRMLALAFSTFLFFDPEDALDRRRRRQAAVIGALLMRAFAHQDNQAYMTAAWHFQELKDVSAPTFQLWNMMSQQIEVFIVLHEFGHALLGHLDARIQTRGSELDGAILYVHRREQEIEADKFAATRIRGMSDIVWISLNVFFAVMTACEAMIGSPAPTTHPAWAARWDHLNNWLSPPPTFRSEGAFFDDLGNIIAEWLDLIQSGDPLSYPLN